MLSKRSKHLIDVATEISLTPALEANSISYIPRFFANVSLPARNVPGNEYVRQNGRYKMHLISPSEIGLPSGTYPRQLIIHFTTQAKITGCSEIYIGSSQSKFLRSLGLHNSGGKTGSLRAVKDQTKRLLASTILWTESKDTSWTQESMRIAQKTSMIWEPFAASNWEAVLKLDNAFFSDILESAIPIDHRVINVCSHYPLAIDIYCWLTHRYYRMPKSQLITWEQLANQFGNIYTRKSHFKDKFVLALERISLLYKKANFSTNHKGLILYPSPSHVSPKDA